MCNFEKKYNWLHHAWAINYQSVLNLIVLRFDISLLQGTQARENIKSSSQRGVADPLLHMSEGISGGAAPAEEVFRNPVLPKIRTGFPHFSHPNKIKNHFDDL